MLFSKLCLSPAAGFFSCFYMLNSQSFKTLCSLLFRFVIHSALSLVIDYDIGATFQICKAYSDSRIFFSGVIW